MQESRRFWAAYEPLHSFVYFHPRLPEIFAERGLHGYWNMYFALRAAPLGPVGPAPVAAIFFGFAPPMVAKALPKVWGRMTPETALEAGVAGAGEVLGELTRGVESGALLRAAELLERAVDTLDIGSRPLGAAFAAVPRPDDLPGRLWLAASALREHRGDGHVAAAAVGGLSGLQTTVLHVATGEAASREWMQRARGWSDEEWEEAVESLRSKGFLDGAGALTAVGREWRTTVEAQTDAMAASVPDVRGADDALATLVEVSRAVRGAGFLPEVNPIGLPRL